VIADSVAVHRLFHRRARSDVGSAVRGSSSRAGVVMACRHRPVDIAAPIACAYFSPAP